MQRCSLHRLIFLLIIFSISGCMPSEKTLEKESRKQVYVDANLLFEISYPEEWARSRKPISLSPLSKLTTTWIVEQQQEQELNLELSILSLPSELNPYGDSGLEDIIKKQNSELIIHSNEDVVITAGPAKKLRGKTLRSTYEIWTIKDDQRHYVISCSAASYFFEQYQDKFHQIVDSFKTLD